ncbi:MAG TPA: hypothetical protein VFS60_00370 [Thermoanaerobaculia bacterium]|nr:hypothetical protein [Thermoanaerobaculia bacterium]
MAALNVITGRVTNPGATLTALTLDTGDSSTIKFFDASQPAYITDVWAQAATPGVVRIRSPRLHDPNQGIRLRTDQAPSRSLLPLWANQYVVPQDLLTFEGSGGGAEVDVFAFLIYYSNLLQNAAHLITVEELEARQRNISGAEVTVTSSATAGQYGGATALNATFDNWKRNVDYAILGILSDTAGCTVGITGPDTGQVRIGMPMAVEAIQTADYFVKLSWRNRIANIPVINAANIAATTIDCATTTTAGTVNFTVIAAELSPSGYAQQV